MSIEKGVYIVEEHRDTGPWPRKPYGAGRGRKMTYRDGYYTTKRAQYGARFDDAELAPQFWPAIESGDRIEVDIGNGEVKRGRVGVTTGWRPCFMLMARRNCIGSSVLLNRDSRILRTVSHAR
jgi:hypothetical protein